MNKNLPADGSTQSRREDFDTDQQYLGNVYARALLGMSPDPAAIGQVVEELEELGAALDKLPRFRTILESRRIAFADKERIIDRAIGNRASRRVLNFLKVVTRKGRADCLRAITRAARRIYDEASGRVQATMITAQPVDETVERKVAERLRGILGKEVAIRKQVDPGILGGLVVRVGDTVYDGSIRNQLERVRVQVLDRTNQQIRASLDRFALEA